MCIRSFAFASAIFGGICLAQSAAPPTQPLPAPSPQAPASAPASQPASQSEMSTHDAPATFNTRVFLVQVPVVVRDKQGHAIGTLHKEDFQLFDKGKPQIITRFTVEKAGISAIPAVKATNEAFPDSEQPDAPIPQRFVAYLFDDVHLDPADIARMREATKQHLDQTMDPITRAAIYTTSGIGGLDFTDDRNKIHEALDRIQPNMRTPSAGYFGGDCPHITLYMADLIVNKADTTALTVAETDAKACD